MKHEPLLRKSQTRKPWAGYREAFRARFFVATLLGMTIRFRFLKGEQHFGTASLFQKAKKLFHSFAAVLPEFPVVSGKRKEPLHLVEGAFRRRDKKLSLPVRQAGASAAAGAFRAVQPFRVPYGITEGLPAGETTSERRGQAPKIQPLAQETPLHRLRVRPVPDQDGRPVKKGGQFIAGKSGNEMETEKPVPFQKRPELFRRRPKGPEIFLHVHRLKIKPSRSFVKIEVAPRERFHPPAEPDSSPAGAGSGNPDRAYALEEEVEGDVPFGTGIPAEDDPGLADEPLGNGVAHG